MPISQQLYRRHIGNYHINSNKNITSQAAQQALLRELANYPGDATKNLRAMLALQALLSISNISLATGEMYIRAQTDKARVPRSLAGLSETPYFPMAAAYGEGGISLGRNTSLLLQHGCQYKRGKKKGQNYRHNTASSPKPDAGTTPPVIMVPGSDVSASDAVGLNKSKRKHRERDPVSLQTDNINLFLTRHYGKDNENNIAAIIDKTIHFIIHCPNGLADISRVILKHSGEYGAQSRETLSDEQQYSVVRSWLSAVVFEKSLGEFIGRVIVQAVRENACSDRQPLKLPNEVLYSYIVSKIGIQKPDGAASGEKVFSFDDSARNYLSHEVLFEELPFLSLSLENIDNHNIYVGTVDWGYLHAGLIIAKRTGKDISQFALNELIQLGSSLEDMLSEEIIDPELVGIFHLPAKLLYIKQQAERENNIEIETIFRSEEGDKNALEAFFSASDRQKAEENPYNLFTQTLRNYRTRTQLREMTKTPVAAAGISQTALNDKAAGPYCLDAASPADLEPADADRLFKEQNEDIAAKYAVVDTFIVALAFERLDPEEIDFLRAAAIYTASAVFSAFDNIRGQMVARILPRHSYTVSLSANVDLFAAFRDGHKRIFALQNHGEKYVLSRVDYNEELYYALMADRIKIRRDNEYKLRIYAEGKRNLLKSAEEPLEQLVGRLIQKHRGIFLNQLHEQGYEETSGEKAQRFLLSLIPLHDCISGIINKKSDAPLSCALDMMLLLPLAGQGLGLASRFAQHGFKGGILAYRSAIGSLAARETLRTALRQGGKEYVRHGILPAAGELHQKAFIQLGLTALRTFDPGLEIAGILGGHALRRVVAAGNLLKEVMPAWKKVLPGLEAILSHRDPRISAEYITTGRLPGRDKDLPVRKLYGEKYHRQPVYVQVDPATGYVFGNKYTLSSTGILHAVPKAMAQRLKNILEVGLSGRGAARSAARLAVRRGRGRPPLPLTPPVTVDHLLRWIENSQNINPLASEEFICHWGLSDTTWSVYVEPSGALTAAAQALLARAGMNEFNNLFRLSPELQRQIIQHLDIAPLRNLLRAFPSYENEHLRAVSLRAFARERLALLQQNFIRVWGDWLAQYFPREKRWLAWERLNLYFERNNRQLILRSLRLTDLPALLPDDILHLDLSGNQLAHVTPRLPENLGSLDVSINFLDRLPDPLPAALNMLDASHNLLSFLPPRLSQSLTFLDLSHNLLTFLPFLPDTLVFLDVSNNNLHLLPVPLPKALTRFAANNNQITVLPDLPAKLIWLEVHNNALQSLPDMLPIELKFLDIAKNQLMNLPAFLPVTLRTIDATANRLMDLPAMLPPNLEQLFVSKNILSFLPPLLPPKLRKICASRNLLTTIPQNLPPGLKDLTLNNNLILVVYPTLPSGLRSLQITNNHVYKLPDNLPDALQILHINHNPIARLPARLPATLKEIDVSYTNVPGRPADLPAHVNFIQKKSQNGL
ncbi:hypothetical protein [Sodalis sp. dw_96]|uniref:hypothetical protein n=1 Tax=Sodalis sp. dw_96 TaxID=2719794 RepID=UPI001BD32B91|nr:hypothetical protein [Sodalis sp. dw_96]